MPPEPQPPERQFKPAYSIQRLENTIVVILNPEMGEEIYKIAFNVANNSKPLTAILGALNSCLDNEPTAPEIISSSDDENEIGWLRRFNDTIIVTFDLVIGDELCCILDDYVAQCNRDRYRTNLPPYLFAFTRSLHNRLNNKDDPPKPQRIAAYEDKRAPGRPTRRAY